MKKMKFLSVLSVFVLLFSCSQQETQASEELLAVNAKTEQNQDDDKCFYSVENYNAIAKRELSRLKEIKGGLVVEIEEGNDDAIDELERVQKEISQFENLSEDLFILVPPKRPRPPKGCLNDPEIQNCKIDIDLIESISYADGVKLHKVEIRDAKNNIVGKGTKDVEDCSGDRALLVKSEFKGNATMYFTIETEFSGLMVLPLAVFKD